MKVPSFGRSASHLAFLPWNPFSLKVEEMDQTTTSFADDDQCREDTALGSAPARLSRQGWGSGYRRWLVLPWRFGGCAETFGGASASAELRRRQRRRRRLQRGWWRRRRRAAAPAAATAGWGTVRSPARGHGWVIAFLTRPPGQQRASARGAYRATQAAAAAAAARVLLDKESVAPAPAAARPCRWRRLLASRRGGHRRGATAVASVAGWGAARSPPRPRSDNK